MSEEDLRAIAAHLAEIANDPKGWLEAFGPYVMGPASEMLRTLAERLAAREHLAEELAYDEWCKRYGLDAGQNLTRFLRGLCTHSLREIRCQLDQHSLDIQNLVAHLRRQMHPEQTVQALDVPADTSAELDAALKAHGERVVQLEKR